MEPEQKNFDLWNALKKNLHYRGREPLFRTREIWWCVFGVNIGVEADGKHVLFERPVLVIKKFNGEMFWGLPLTSRNKNGPYHASFPFHEGMSFAVLSQLRTLSSKRLVRKIGKLSWVNFNAILGSIAHLMMTNAEHKKTDPLQGPRVPIGN